MCYSLLLITFYFYSKDRKIKSANVIVFLAAFLSTLLNAAAPGNFARHGIESKESMDLAKSIADTIKVFWDTNVWLFYKMNFGALIVVAIVCGLFINKVLVDKKAYLIVSLASLVMPFITIFPVVLGYNVPWIPNRCLFITVTVMTLVYINLAVVFGNIIRLKAEKAKTVMGVLVVIAILLTVVSPYEYHRCITLKLNKYLYNGYIQDYYNEFLTMTSEFENQQNCDVIIDIPECPEALAQQYYPFYITDDPDNKFNQGVAWAYGLKSIAATEYEAP
ncbi:DUF6056 family protein [Butyrivibrio sp.]|uniref:DUF6056 family protein n=1 Tax=Butyrivibrio sp. TaxID=28121 RepID=UPI0025BD896E|nr:DUF6056 family protein [Butyrivibrio sp.]